MTHTIELLGTDGEIIEGSSWESSGTEIGKDIELATLDGSHIRSMDMGGLLFSRRVSDNYTSISFSDKIYSIESLEGANIQGKGPQRTLIRLHNEGDSIVLKLREGVSPVNPDQTGVLYTRHAPPQA